MTTQRTLRVIRTVCFVSSFIRQVLIQTKRKAGKLEKNSSYKVL